MFQTVVDLIPPDTATNDERGRGGGAKRSGTVALGLKEGPRNIG